MNKISITALLALFTAISYAQPKVQFTEDKHDFGTIKEDGGDVSHIFGFKNTGDKPLVISQVKTPCGCTTPKWTRDTIAPGKGGYVEAVFDPLHRPGVFDKVLTVETNAIPNKYFLTITGDVLPRKRTVVDNFPAKRGHLRFKLPQIYMGKLNNEETDSVHVRIYNELSAPIEIYEVITPEHIKADIVTPKVPGLGYGKVILKYDALKRGELGFLTDEITIRTNDMIEPSKKMMVLAEVDIHFGALTPKQLEEAPKIEVSPMVLELGEVKEGQKVSGKFEITNNGKTAMKIVQIMPECGCTSTKAPNEMVYPDETTVMEVVFDATNQSGYVTKVIDMYCTDPLNSHVVLKIKAKVIPAAEQ